MSAAIQFRNATNPVTAEAFVETPRNNVSYFEAAPENRLRRALECIQDLQAEVRTLRDELARAERASAQYEKLLQNALVREQELKAMLGKQMSS